MDLKHILQGLKSEIGEVPKITIEDFENWGKTQKPGKVLTTTPTSTEQVQRVIKAARKKNLKVRAVGSTHSWSPLYPDEGNILIYGTGLKLHNGERIHYNGDETVTITSGVTNQELMDFFLDKKLKQQFCFPSNVILRNVTCAGIVSTGCHGVGGNQLCISDWITAVTLVDSKGEIREFKLGEKSVDGVDVMKAIQVSLGMFGILITITMKVQKQFLVRTDNLFPRVVDFFFDPGHLKEFVNKNWSVEMFWFPFNGMEIEHFDLLRTAIKGHVGEYSWNPMIDELWVRAINPYKKGDLHLPPVDSKYLQHDRFDDKLTNKLLKYEGKFEHLVHKLGGEKMDKFFHRHFDPISMYLSFKVIKDQYGPAVGVCQQITDAIHYRTISTKNLVPVYDMSFAFNCPNTLEGFHTICKAITKVVELVQKYAIDGRYPLSTTMEMRWISHSETLLAPAIVGKPEGYTFYLEILSYEDTDKALIFFKEVAAYWMTIESGGVKPLPHWGKQWSFIPGMNTYLREGYGDKIEMFKNIRDHLKVDEENMFTNGVLMDIFNLGP